MILGILKKHKVYFLTCAYTYFCVKVDFLQFLISTLAIRSIEMASPGYR